MLHIISAYMCLYLFMHCGTKNIKERENAASSTGRHSDLSLWKQNFMMNP